MGMTEKILRYWFGDSDNDLLVLKQKGKLWFGKDPQVDREIEARFAKTVAAAAEQGVLHGAEPVSRRYLATIILLDQFTRNIYRGDPKSFACDPIALQLALEALRNGYDQQLRPIERVFVYLPLEHAEQLQHQNRAVELFTTLSRSVVEDLRPAFAGFLDYALRHQEIIVRFGRFPHRNAILGRKSSAAEVEFLKQPNSSF